MQRSAIFHPRPSALPTRRLAYTLLEVMVVVVIIVLMIGMALPVFHVITGSRSEAGASNIIASMLSRARADALGLQKPIGVAFVYNATKQQSYMAEVEFPDCPYWAAGFNQQTGSCVKVSSTTVPSFNYYFISTNTPTIPSVTPGAAASDTGSWQWVSGPPIEMRQDTDVVPLPTGIGTQTVCNCNLSAGTRISDGYLAVGVIVFDGSGRLTSTYYGIPKSSRIAIATGLTDGYPTHDYYTGANGGNIGAYNSAGSFDQFGVLSQFGLVVFQQEAFQNQQPSPPPTDALYLDKTPVSTSTALPDYTTGTPSQQSAETWLDQNATPLLINRYTGTLVKAE